MLTLQESRIIFKLLRFWSKVNVFPFTVNVRLGKLTQFQSWRMALWRISYLLAVLHCLYGLLSAIYTLLLRREDVVLYHLPVQFDAILAPSILHFPIAIALMSNVQVVAKLFNEFYNGSKHTPCRHWTKLNITEMIAIGVCFAVIGTLSLYMIMVCMESSMSHLLINSSLLTSYKGNFGGVILAYGIELYSFSFCVVNAGFLLIMNALVIAKVHEELKAVMKNLRECENIDDIEVSLKTSRKVQLYLQMFNGFNAWFIQAFKTAAILTAIVHGYFGIRFRSNLVLTAFCLFFHVAANVVYCGTFQRAYQLASGQLRVRRNIVAVCRQVRDRKTRKNLLLEVKSFRSIGLKVGQFHEIQRNSSVMFVDFVERLLVRILVIF